MYFSSFLNEKNAKAGAQVAYHPYPVEMENSPIFDKTYFEVSVLGLFMFFRIQKMFGTFILDPLPE